MYTLTLYRLLHSVGCCNYLDNTAINGLHSIQQVYTLNGTDAGRYVSIQLWLYCYQWELWHLQCWRYNAVVMFTLGCLVVHCWLFVKKIYMYNSLGKYHWFYMRVIWHLMFHSKFLSSCQLLVAMHSLNCHNGLNNLLI